MEDFVLLGMTFQFIFMVILLAFAGLFITRYWFRGIKIWRRLFMKIVGSDEGGHGINSQSNNMVKEEKETQSHTTGIIITAVVCLAYFLSEYLFRYPSLPHPNVILAILFTLLYGYHSIVSKKQSERLFLVLLGLAGFKLAIYYCDYMILAYDFYIHANINLTAYYILKIATILNLLLFLIKGIHGFLSKVIHKADKNMDEMETALYRYVDNALKFYKMGGPRYQASAEERKKESGKEGEANVRYHLKWLEGYKVLHNVRIPNPLESQEFDHIVIGENGVFHLETKNHVGKHGAKIVINKEGDWSIIQNGYAQGMTNPLFQVRRHERVLREFLEREFPQMDLPIKEIVVLSNEKTILEGQENSPITVLKVERLNDFIMSYESGKIIDKQTVELIYDKLAKLSKGNLDISVSV